MVEFSWNTIDLFYSSLDHSKISLFIKIFPFFERIWRWAYTGVVILDETHIDAVSGIV